MNISNIEKYKIGYQNKMLSSLTISSFNSINNFLVSSLILGSFEHWIKITKTYILGSWIEVYVLILFMYFKYAGVHYVVM